MVAVLLTILLTYLITTLFGFVAHWSFHQKWTGAINKKHMTHHLKLYPPSDYLSDVYRSPGKDNTVFMFFLASLPLILAPIILFLLGWVSLTIMFTILLTQAAVGFFHDYIHDSFHIRNHWMTKNRFICKSFARWNQLHYLHHVDMQKNFGIFSFHWDRVFGRFWSK